MARPPLEVADLIRAAGTTFYQRSRKWFTWLHLKIPMRSETVLALGDAFSVKPSDELLTRIERLFGERVAVLR